MSNPDSSSSPASGEGSGRTWLHNLKWFGIGAVFGSTATIAVGIMSDVVPPEAVGIDSASKLGEVLTGKDKAAAA